MKCLLFLILLINFKLNETTYCYEYSPRCYCEYNNTLVCNNFMSLSDLNFDRYINLRLKYIHLRPLKPIMFDSYIYFNFLNFDNELEITLSNFNGFDLLINPFDGLVDANKNMTLIINSSTLYFYYTNQLIDTTLCNTNYFSANFKPLFSSFNKIILAETVNFPRRTCPLLFQNSNINQLVLNRITDSNRLNFMDSTEYESVKFKLANLEIYNSRFSMNTLFINKYVFRYLSAINTYNSSLISFESGLLRPFVFLTRLQFDLWNFSQFAKRFKYDQSNWLLDLNKDLDDVNLVDRTENILQVYKNKQILVVFSDTSQSYEYADSDFCLYRKFPFRKMVYPAIKTRSSLTCSCTLVWLIQYIDTYKSKEDVITDSVRDCLNRPDFKNILVACDFPRRIEICENREVFYLSKANTQSEQSSSIILFALILFSLTHIYS